MDSKGGALLGDGRFVLGRQLGKGGMGVVFEAYDRHREERVALKTLSYVDGAAVYRLKREFRTLANVAHNNLVSLYELFADGDQWFFTMELVEGDSFLSHVRPRSEPGEDPSNGRLLGSVLNEARLRSSLQQLVEGILALHAAGKVHRDIKPSNVLVTPAGRVVILDFGIAGDLRPQPLPTTISSWAPGTAVYMSPEHAAGERTTPANDWYSIGVMLFEALTGKLPYEGSALNVIYRKQQEDPPRVSDLEPRAPPDLASLGDALLARDPSRRPDGASILRHLGLPDPATEAEFRATSERNIVGRETHLSAIESALRATRGGRTVTVYVHGPSGMGKSTVVEHFTHDLARRREAVVLTGRCYDRESVPYKALDGVIDSLSQYLRTLGPGELKSLLPQDIHTVGRLFPVLRRVQAIGDEPSDFFDRPEPIELRRRAVAALRELLVRISARRPLVISVDDLQWTDQDSIALGGDLLRGPGAPDLLLLVSFRSEEIAAKPFLGEFLARADGDSKRELTVGPLTPVQSVTLARSLLERSLPDADQLVPSIVEEAGGSPFLIEQLVRYTNESELPAAAGTTLTEMLDARIRRLPAGARPLLQTLAVAGGPVDFAIAHRAAGLEDRSGDARALVGALRVAHMIRPSGGADLIELYHDRIREALAARVTAEQAAQIHSRLALALSETAVDDPEALFRHYLAAGESARAGEQAAIAAERAAEALAFDRAVALFERAIEIGARGAEELATWKAGLAEALANAGRPGDAAHAYLDAAMHSSSDARAIALRRSAAENFLIGGHNDRGLEVTRGLLEEVGMSMPESPRRVLLSLFFLRARISLRGLGYELTGADGASKLDLLRMDICWACAIGLTMTDYIVAAYFQARYLLLALDTGEAQRVARALAFEVGFLAARGAPARRRMQAVAEKAESLAEQLGSPREVGMAAVTKGSAYCMLGDFERSAELCEQAERILRERCTGVQWELTTCQIFLLTSLTYLGKTGEVIRRVPLLLESSHKRGNLFEGVELRTRQNLYWLFIDDPEGARRELTGAMSRWTRDGFYRQDYNCLLAETQIDLYVGQPLVAWARLENRWKALRRSQLLRVQLLRCESLHLRGRVALAVAEQGHSREDALRVALQAARKIERERVAWAQPFVSMLRAGVSAVRGDEVSTAPMLAKAIAGFESAGMRLYAAAARRRLGQVLGGDEGQRLREQGDAFMTSESIRSPLHLTAVLAPGFGPQDSSFSRLREPPPPR